MTDKVERIGTDLNCCCHNLPLKNGSQLN